ncbi:MULTISPECIES: MauE/DoxX family redox-associated membrane protein [Sphingobacterium]|jgi:hypothetical protein|uniref:MauE/DoxX family redox-associated membrane protein n=1 Tax=Sphingobacterium TaxID=28453 RepID=UPI0008A32926|nr:MULTISPECIES: MauE/DoxX family redox-associated membrane protein [Sphingobacterium]OFV10591.1 hypothetical protein HMPREF3127_21165 [Sphingobacterium sp. HMSC13C05]
MKIKLYINYTAHYGFTLLWGSTLVLKLWNLEITKSEIAMQGLPLWMSDMLLLTLPLVNIVLICMLLYKPTVSLGIRLSTLTIAGFTLYLIIGITGVMGHTPCACAGIWPTNNHWLHIALNSIFIAIGISYWVLAHKSHTERDVNPDLGRKEGTILS